MSEERACPWRRSLSSTSAPSALIPAAAAVTQQIAGRALEEGVMIVPGMRGMIDGVQGDHIQTSPPYSVIEVNAEQLLKPLEVAT